MKIHELDASQARFSYSKELVAELRKNSSANGIIGQPRALSALKMGMSVLTKGYNIYISGEDGTGRHSAVYEIASGIKGPVYDLAYAYNFTSPQSPTLLVLPTPMGSELQNTMNNVAFCVANGNFEEAKAIISNTDYNGVIQLKGYLYQIMLALSREESEPDAFRINLVVDNRGRKDIPVITEYHPTHATVFGQISGRNTCEHMSLSCGSLLQAAGGFFVVNLNQVLNEPSLWQELKLFAESSSFLVHSSDVNNPHFVRPLTTQLKVKIILIGSDELYEKMCDTDEQFLRLFKVCAEFDYSMPANNENISGTISYIQNLCKARSLKPVTDDAICELLNYSSWYAEMRNELTTKLSFIGDLLEESDYFAKDVIDAVSVRKAMAERDFAAGITESRISSEIENGEMIISLEGTKVGVVNGLAIMDRGLASFGTPTVISVSVAPGSEGIVNIEHEAGLSGEIHDKGLLILEGYLRKQYARNFPLSIYAGICFEQSYAEVDGDSASSSELFALLSAIGELPVRQDIAVTGSVNQMGDIQPVGGINEKISGFFNICNTMGLTGSQGVIIPKQNVKSLILPENVIKAVEEKKFHIYPISTIDEGMEILTWRPCGIRNQKGTFPPDTVNRVIEDRLKKLYELSKPAN